MILAENLLGSCLSQIIEELRRCEASKSFLTPLAQICHLAHHTDAGCKYATSLQQNIPNLKNQKFQPKSQSYKESKVSNSITNTHKIQIQLSQKAKAKKNQKFQIQLQIQIKYKYN